MFFQKKKAKFLFSLVILLISVACLAQNRNFLPVSQNDELSTEKKEIPNALSLTSLLCDTVSHFTSSDSAFLYKNAGTGNWGYISGTNSYKDKAKAEKFLAADYNPANKLVGVILFFAKAVDGDTASTMVVKAWDNDGVNGYPSTTLASAPVSVSQMQTGDNGTVIMFPNPVNVTGDFYLGLDSFLYQAVQQDTIAVYSDSMNLKPVNSAFEKWSDNTWHAFTEQSTWGSRHSLKIAAILCDSVSIGIKVLNPTSDVIIFPNPSEGYFYIQANGNPSTSVLKILDAAGREVSNSDNISYKDGTYTVSLGHLMPGFYFVRLVLNNRVFSRKIAIN